MSDVPPQILEYAHPHRPSRNVIVPTPLAANAKASIPLAIGVFYLPICVPLGLVAFLVGAGVDALAGKFMPPPFAHAVGYIATAGCLSWPLFYGWSNGLKAFAEIRLSPARGRGQAVLGMLLCALWLFALIAITCLRIAATFDR